MDSVPNPHLDACTHTNRHASLTEAKDGVVLYQRPGVVIQTVALVDQKLTDVSSRHVCWNLHHFTGPILTPHLHDLKTHENNDGNTNIRAVLLT